MNHLTMTKRTERVKYINRNRRAFHHFLLEVKNEKVNKVLMML